MFKNNLALSKIVTKTSICYLKGKKLILIFIKKFIYCFEIPGFIYLSKPNKQLLSYSKLSQFGNNSTDVYFLKNFLNFFQNVQVFSKKILILKGLGLKVNIKKFFLESCLEFKLGYSHLLVLQIDKEIFIRIKKNILFLQSINKEKLGNFIFKIKSLKRPDSYKGKGIWYKNEKIRLKQVKKK